MTIRAGSPDSWATQNFDYDSDMVPADTAADDTGAPQHDSAREPILDSETSDGNKRLRDNWYHPAALALASVSVSKEDSQNAVCLDSIKDAGTCNKGVFFDVVNTSSEPIFITQIEAGERDRERERQTDRERDRERDRQTDRERESSSSSERGSILPYCRACHEAAPSISQIPTLLMIIGFYS